MILVALCGLVCAAHTSASFDLLGYVEVRELCVLFDEIHPDVAAVFDEADREDSMTEMRIRLVSYVHFASFSVGARVHCRFRLGGVHALRFWLVEAIQPRRIVEIGTRDGQSFMAFGQAIDRLGFDTSLFGIGTWQVAGGPQTNRCWIVCGTGGTAS